MKLLKFIPVLLILTFYSSDVYSAHCDEIKGNIVGKLFCKSKSDHGTESSSSEASNSTEKKDGVLSKIWKKPEWLKKKN